MSASSTRHSESLISANLRSAREASGLSIAGLADAVGAHPRLVLKWLKGEVTPSAKYLPLLAEALGHDMGWFYAEHDKPNGKRAA